MRLISFIILTIVFIFGVFSQAQISTVLIEESKNLDEQKLSATTTDEESKKVGEQNLSASTTKEFIRSSENVKVLRRECLPSNLGLLLKENRDKLKNIYLEYRKLSNLTTSTKERARLLREYKLKAKDLRQEFFLKIKEEREHCQNL